MSYALMYAGTPQTASDLNKEVVEQFEFQLLCVMNHEIQTDSLPKRTLASEWKHTQEPERLFFSILVQIVDFRQVRQAFRCAFRRDITLRTP